MRPLNELTAELGQLKDVNVLCVGDLMLDRFIYGNIDRISPEAPIPVMHVTRETAMLGGVGNVVRNLDALGANSQLISVIGDDTAAGQVREAIDALENNQSNLIVDSARETTIKTRCIGGNQQMIRIDRESPHAISQVIEDELCAAIEKTLPTCSVMVLSDYGKGIFTASMLSRCIELAHKHDCQVIVDPKGTDYSKYAKADIITPNRKELSDATGLATKTDEEISAAAKQLMDSANLQAVLATRSEDGMTLIEANGDITHLGARTREVFDVSGAGDTVVAMLGAGLAMKLDLQDAMQLANIAAGIVVGKIGTATVHPRELHHGIHQHDLFEAETLIAPLNEAKDIVERWRSQDLKIGFTNGCFDLLHQGHVTYLAASRAACDKLILGLNSDDSIRRLKGEDRPIQQETSRATVLASLASVDLVVIFEEDTPINLIENLKPDLLMKGADYTIDGVVGADIVQSYGGEVKLIDLVEGHSTTRLVKRMNDAKDDA